MKKFLSLWFGATSVAAAATSMIVGCGDSNDTSYHAPHDGGGVPTGGAHAASGGAPGTGGARSDAAPGGAGGNSSGGSDAGDAAVTILPIGAHCKSDGDCEGGMTCLKSTDTIDPIGGGPAGGLCTKDCTPSGLDAGALAVAQKTCEALNPLGQCIRFSRNDPKAYCFLSCLPGQVPPSFKCGGRLDLACETLSSGFSGYCAPMCSTDAECGSRVCDLRSGYCKDSHVGKAPMGTPCGADSALAKAGGECEGTCLSIPRADGGLFAYCSGLCVLGTPGCGSQVTPSNTVVPGAGLCVLPVSPNSGGSDLGFCAQACDCDGDCLSPETICTKIPGMPLPGERYGACVPAFYYPNLTGRACGDAGSGDSGPKPTDAGKVTDAADAHPG